MAKTLKIKDKRAAKEKIMAKPKAPFISLKKKVKTTAKGYVIIVTKKCISKSCFWPLAAKKAGRSGTLNPANGKAGKII